MNKIQVINKKSKFSGEIEHEIIVIDNTPLDEILHNYYPEDNILGLIPVIVDWLSDPREQKLVLNRFYSNDESTMLPVLMCPDDCDLWCTIILVEVLITDDCIIWSRFGFDKSNRENLIKGFECIGTNVRWIESVTPMTFDKLEYIENLRKIYLRNN